MEEITRADTFVRVVAPWLVHLAEACSVVVVLYGIVRAAMDFVRFAVRYPRRAGPPTDVRLNLGRALALALEFLLASDILETAIAPSTDAVIQLAVVAVIRTGLNYFLSKELEQEAAELRESVAGATDESARPAVRGGTA